MREVIYTSYKTGYADENNKGVLLQWIVKLDDVFGIIEADDGTIDVVRHKYIKMCR